MGVVVNQLPALGLKTGIGHYTVQLLRCLRVQAGPDCVEGFPEGWVRACAPVPCPGTPLLGRQADRPTRPCARFPANKVLGSLRQFGRRLMAQHFRLVVRPPAPMSSTTSRTSSRCRATNPRWPRFMTCLCFYTRNGTP